LAQGKITGPTSIELWIEDSLKETAVTRLEPFKDLDGETQTEYCTSHNIDLVTNTFSLCLTIVETGYRLDDSLITFNCRYDFCDVLSNHLEDYQKYFELYQYLSSLTEHYPKYIVLYDIFWKIIRYKQQIRNRASQQILFP
jgi:hypothetical protein